MLELVQRINWNEYLLILTQGNPSLALQFLVVNGIIAAFWLTSRVRKRKSKQSSAVLLPLLFVIGNLSVVTLGHRLAT
jgi:hypothetical protein